MYLYPKLGIPLYPKQLESFSFRDNWTILRSVSFPSSAFCYKHHTNKDTQYYAELIDMLISIANPWEAANNDQIIAITALQDYFTDYHRIAYMRQGEALTPLQLWQSDYIPIDPLWMNFSTIRLGPDYDNIAFHPRYIERISHDGCLVSLKLKNCCMDYEFKFPEAARLVVYAERIVSLYKAPNPPHRNAYKALIEDQEALRHHLRPRNTAVSQEVIELLNRNHRAEPVYAPPRSYAGVRKVFVIRS